MKERRYTYICECPETGIIKVGIGFNPHRRAAAHARRVLFDGVVPKSMGVVATFYEDLLPENDLIKLISRYAPNARDESGVPLREWFVGGHSQALADMIYLLCVAECHAPNGTLQVFIERDRARAGHGAH